MENKGEQTEKFCSCFLERNAVVLGFLRHSPINEKLERELSALKLWRQRNLLNENCFSFDKICPVSVN